MPAELRKRKEAPPAPVRPAKKNAPAKGKKAESEKTVVEKVQDTVAETVEAVKEAVASKTNGEASKPAAKTGGAATPGDTINLTTFGGEVETHDGSKTTLAKLVQESKGGVVLFTYPKASTPGCTKQVCLFRDSYEPLTATGYSIYGLSNDSPKANTTFKTKQKLPYTLLCDPAQTLISAIGLKKAPKGTTRGVFVVDKAGKVLAAESGGPAETVEVVRKLVDGNTAGESKEDVEAANTADEVADTAAKVDA
ncbi:AhpC-TSA-domain-containing protein [Ophiobolus disseminans]|uniref:thioredoxin-dependent peroxiredoxin n=1 Tax=Ophiobolus disseminans TaxID=1469910 RepID=A0A6A7AKG0_9PLEO|nr:AhpC-TSA-domain-containing protein [Ophiobolus disseminans]